MVDPIQVQAQSQVRSVSVARWALALLALFVVAVTALGAVDYAYAQSGGGGGGSSVSTPVPDAYEVTMSIPPVNEDAIADTATATFAAYQNVIWLIGGIALGFFMLRRARRLLR